VHESDVAAQHRRWLEQGKSALLTDLRARHTHRSPELVELLAEARMQTSMSAFEVLTPPNPDYRELVKAIDIPILLAIGDNPVVSRETARELQDLNPLLRVEEIPGAGHGVPFDQPERLAAVVGSFIRSLASDGLA
jgi:pimeloyl-ACP methyl ester carboxylesterase